MSIIYCPRCSDPFDSDQHTEPLCKTCMGKVETEYVGDEDVSWWHAFLKQSNACGAGPSEDEAILDLVRAI